LKLFIFLLFLQDLKYTPHYRILINKANGFGKSTAYIPEEEITIITGLEVAFIFIQLQLVILYVLKMAELWLNRCYLFCKVCGN